MHIHDGFFFWRFRADSNNLLEQLVDYKTGKQTKLSGENVEQILLRKQKIYQHFGTIKLSTFSCQNFATTTCRQQKTCKRVKSKHLILIVHGRHPVSHQGIGGLLRGFYVVHNKSQEVK